MFDWKSGRVKRSAVADPLQTLIPVRDYEGARASFKLNAGMFFVFFAVFSLAYYMFSSLAHIAEVSAWPFDLLYSGYTILGFVALCRMYHNILRAKKHIIEREKEVRAEMR